VEGKRRKTVKYAIILGNLGNTNDRFLASGYKEQPTKEEMLKRAAAIEGVEGVELVGTWDVTADNVEEVGGLLAKYNLKCASIIPDHFAQKRWGSGAFSSKDPAIRAQAVEETAKMAEAAFALGCDLVSLWPGQDGYDYCFQADYRQERLWIEEAVRSLAQRVGEPNVGVTIDTGHSFVAGENVAEAAVMLSMYGDKLFHLHFAEYVELLFWLREIGYRGWYSMDQYPYREEAQGALRESIEFLKAIDRLLDQKSIGEIRELVRRGDAVQSTRWLRKRFLS
jgi:xylose isomerase